MNLEELASRSGVIRQEHVKSLLQCLETKQYGWLISDPHDERLQGDLIREMPLALVGRDGAPRCRPHTAMVINSVCDLEPGRSQLVTVAPVHEFERYAEFVARNATTEESEGKARSHLADVQANHVHGLLYIPHCAYLKNGGLVRLDSICSVSAVVYEQALSGGKRLASLTQNGFYYLLMKLTGFFARLEPGDVQRKSHE